MNKRFEAFRLHFFASENYTSDFHSLGVSEETYFVLRDISSNLIGNMNSLVSPTLEFALTWKSENCICMDVIASFCHGSKWIVRSIYQDQSITS